MKDSGSAPAQPPSSLQTTLTVLCLLLVFVFACLLFIDATSDDAYITMRYARNAATGEGLVYSPGERVEGYSNPLWLGLLVIAAKLGAGLVGAAKVMGLAAAAAAMLLALGIIGRVTGQRGGLNALGLLPLVTSAALVVYATSGLETVLYACLLTGVVYWWPRAEEGQWWAAAGCAVGAALTRPEGALVLAAVVIWRGVTLALENKRDAESPRGTVRVYWLSLPLIALVMGGFLLARHAYYGDWLPNTFYAKPPGAFGTMGLLSPLTYLRDYLLDDGAWLWLALVVAWPLAVFMADRALPRHSAMIVAGLLIAGVQAALVIHARGDWMALHRFLVPVTPLLVGLGYGALIRLQPPRAVLVGVPVLLALLNLVQLAQVREQFMRGEYPYSVMAGQPQEMAGKWLRAHFPANTIVATKRIGGVGYFSGLRIVDTLGLVDREIAMIRHHSEGRGPQEQAAIAAEVFSRKPDLIMLAVMERWDNIPLSEPAPDVAENLRDVDKALFDGLQPHGYRFIYRLPQGGSGEFAVYAAPWMQGPPLTGP